MAITLLTSAGGSPGVTTVAVGLALTWPRPVLLVDADPGAHQAVLAGYLAGQSAGGRGLLRIAEAHRDGRPLREVLIDQTLPLTGDERAQRLFLPGFTRPGSAGHFAGVWEDLAEALDRLGEVGIDVIVDGGRLTAAGLPAPLVERSAVTGLVLESSLRAVISARVHLPLLRDHPRLAQGGGGQLGLLLVAEGQPYGRAEIARALGAPVIGGIARDPLTAPCLSDGRPRHRRFESSPLLRSLRDVTATLAVELQRSSELAGSQR